MVPIRERPWEVLTAALVLALAGVFAFLPHGTLADRGEVSFFHLQARAFLDGRLDLDLPPDFRHDVIREGSRKYLAIPPLNAFLVLPFVALFGDGFPERIFTWCLLAGHLAVLLAFVGRHVTADRSLWLLFLSLGTMLFPCAVVGTSSFSSVLSSSLWLSLSALCLLESRPRSALWLLVLAALGRWHLILLAPLYLAALRPEPRRWPAFAAPLAAFAGFVAWWNWARFGDPFALRYTDHGYAGFFADTISRYGFRSWRYVFPNLYHGLLSFPRLGPSFPFLSPDPAGNGVFAMSPLFLFAVFRQRPFGRREWFAAACLLTVAVPVLLHFSTGWRQVGYRYLLDVFPFAVFLLTRADFRMGSPLALFLVALSVGLHLTATLCFVGFAWGGGP